MRLLTDMFVRSGCSVSEVEEYVRELLGAESVKVTYDSQGGAPRKARSDASFYSVLSSHPEVSITAVLARGSDKVFKGEDTRPSMPTPADAAGHGQLETVSSPPHPVLADFLRKLAEMERTSRGGFVWLGFVLNDVLPQMGFGKEEARRFIHDLDTKGLVAISKVPSPKNPEYQASRIQVNTAHPEVNALLEASSADFTPIPVRGEPVSRTILQDRDRTTPQDRDVTPWWENDI